MAKIGVIETPNVGGMAIQKSLLSAYISNAYDGEKKGENSSEICARILLARLDGEKRASSLSVMEKAMGSLGFLKSTEVGRREGAK